LGVYYLLSSVLFLVYFCHPPRTSFFLFLGVAVNTDVVFYFNTYLSLSLNSCLPTCIGGKYRPVLPGLLTWSYNFLAVNKLSQYRGKKYFEKNNNTIDKVPVSPQILETSGTSKRIRHRFLSPETQRKSLETWNQTGKSPMF